VGKGSAIFDFGVGKLNEGGKISIPASVGTAQPVSQATSQPEKPKRGPGRPKKVGTTSGVAAKEALERQRAAHSGADGMDMWYIAPLEAPPARRKAKGRPPKDLCSRAAASLAQKRRQTPWQQE